MFQISLKWPAGCKVLSRQPRCGSASVGSFSSGSFVGIKVKSVVLDCRRWVEIWYSSQKSNQNETYNMSVEDCRGANCKKTRRSFCVFLFQDGFTSSSSSSLSLLKFELLRRKSLALFLRSWMMRLYIKINTNRIESACFCWFQEDAKSKTTCSLVLQVRERHGRHRRREGRHPSQCLSTGAPKQLLPLADLPHAQQPRARRVRHRVRRRVRRHVRRPQLPKRRPRAAKALHFPQLQGHLAQAR